MSIFSLTDRFSELCIVAPFLKNPESLFQTAKVFKEKREDLCSFIMQKCACIARRTLPNFEKIPSFYNALRTLNLALSHELALLKLPEIKKDSEETLYEYYRRKEEMIMDTNLVRVFTEIVKNYLEFSSMSEELQKSTDLHETAQNIRNWLIWHPDALSNLHNIINYIEFYPTRDLEGFLLVPMGKRSEVSPMESLIPELEGYFVYKVIKEDA